MSLKILLDIKGHIESDAMLSAHFSSVYGKNANHVIGYKKPQSANDYPVVCYTPVNTKHDFAGNVTAVVSIVVGINSGVGSGGRQATVSEGITKLDDVTKILLASLRRRINDYYHKLNVSEIEIIGDLALGHPYHECEIIFTAILKKTVNYESV